MYQISGSVYVVTTHNTQMSRVTVQGAEWLGLLLKPRLMTMRSAIDWSRSFPKQQGQLQFPFFPLKYELFGMLSLKGKKLMPLCSWQVNFNGKKPPNVDVWTRNKKRTTSWKKNLGFNSLIHQLFCDQHLWQPLSGRLGRPRCHCVWLA